MKLFCLLVVLSCTVAAKKCVIPQEHYYCPTEDGRGMVFAKSPDMSDCPGAYIFHNTGKLDNSMQSSNYDYVCALHGSLNIENEALTNTSTLGIVGEWDGKPAGLTTAHGFRHFPEKKGVVFLQMGLQSARHTVGNFVQVNESLSADCAVFTMTSNVGSVSNSLVGYANATDKVRRVITLNQNELVANGSAIGMSGGTTRQYHSGILFRNCSVCLSSTECREHMAVYAMVSSSYGDSGSVLWSPKSKAVVGTLVGSLPEIHSSFGMAWEDVKDACGFKLTDKVVRVGEDSGICDNNADALHAYETATIILGCLLGLLILLICLYGCCLFRCRQQMPGFMQLEK